MNDIKDLDSLGSRIKFIRDRVMHITQDKLAEMLGLSGKAVISNWEKGQNEPSVHNLVTITKLSKTSIKWLLTGEGSPLLKDYKKDKSNNYGITKEELELITKVWDVPEARHSAYIFLKEKIEKYAALENIDEDRLSQTKFDDKN